MANLNSSPPQAPPLALPPAILHQAPGAPHPDSEEFIRSERHRTAQELEHIRTNASADASSSRHLSPTTLQARRAFSHRSRGSSAPHSPNHRGHYPATVSEISTAFDSEGIEARNARRYRLQRQVPHWYDPVVKFWMSNISLTVDEGSHRDHLALERTFLGYLRTSLAFSFAGVIIAQLFRLQHSVNPSPDLGFFMLGKPLAAAFIGCSLVTLLFGAYRFWKQQDAMVRGKVFAGGWEITIIMAGSILLCLIVFTLAIAIDVRKSYF